MAHSELPRKLWEHPDPESTQMYAFMQEANKTYGLQLKTYNDLYRWSCDERSQFYGLLFEWGRIIHSGSYTRVVDEDAPIDSIPRWFEGIRLNWAENLLYSRERSDSPGHRGTKGKEDDKIAITEVREGGGEVREVTWRQLRAEAGKMAAAMKARGVKKGDRIVLVGANSVDTALVFIAATWLGAMFSSSSTDMGVGGILQRTVQIDPKFIFFDDAALYNGRRVDLREKMTGVSKGMLSSPSFEALVTIPRWRDAPLDVSSVPRAETLTKFLASAPLSTAYPAFEHVEFHDPFLVYYSSGTTGVPKAIVHAVGNITLNLIKEGRLHEGTTEKSAGLQYTTTGWIMYLSNVSQLVLGSRAIMYDGSPLQPDAGVLVRVAAAYRATKLGISPRWLAEVAAARISPREHADLSALHVVTTTGMVLPDQLFEWFYDVGFPSRVHLANISGGTDIAGCFGQQNPLTPVYLGGTQGPSLGVPVAVYDALLPDGPGTPVPDGEPGELVATAAFPNIPIYLWGDTATPSPGPRTLTAPPGSRYHSAYFARFDHVWAHGDFVVVNPATGGLSFLGRADGVLNPSGVRFGSAEIYAVVDRLFADRVADSLCIGRRRPGDQDEAVMLFLLMRPGCRFDEALAKDVRAAIGRELTKRHIPRFVFETPEIPTTVNLKKVELPVKHIVSGKTVKPSGTLLNPGSLEYYYQFAKVEESVAPKGKL
ncbi:acetoacetyl-coenzyme A synthetase [Plectosphaerella plurivora]|uniref:Acetoacetyl-coenzyme A synthetase n=1 Tax=Plectosphaerella plurivora TaxID=936078 RepID=A0A9P8VDI4_9PEZI|nr:acetoacetyl-coenzyme A synthetase [Plectosphaerella plurivora]